MPGVHWEMIRMFELATTIKNPGIRIISVSCDLDSYTAEHLRRELTSLIRQRIYQFIINLSKVESINSRAVSILIGLSKQVRQQKGALKVCGLTNSLKRTVDLVGASKILEVHGLEADAIASF
jgi:anti-sigma B factor antagonist